MFLVMESREKLAAWQQTICWPGEGTRALVRNREKA